MLEELFPPPTKPPLVSPRSFGEIVIMASALEREEPKPEQRPLVAGILWKRTTASGTSGWTPQALHPRRMG